jgi:hypothetical protein
MKTLKYIISCSLIILLPSCALLSKNPEKAFHKKTEEIVELLSKESSPNLYQKVNKMSLELIELAKPIVAKQKDLYPDCVAFLNKVEGDLPKMKNLSLEQIEKDYHAGEALPDAPEHCFEAKEMIVHPTTVYILSKQPLDDISTEKALDELLELVAHFELIAE